MLQCLRVCGVAAWPLRAPKRPRSPLVAARYGHPELMCTPRTLLRWRAQRACAEMQKPLVPGGPPPPPFDLIIEDGSHRHADQQMNLALLMPLLKPGGLYFLEDLHTSLEPGYDEPAKGKDTTLYVRRTVFA